MKKLKEPKYWLALPVILTAYLLVKGGGQPPTRLILRLALLCGGYAAALTDLLEKRVPNRLTAGLAAAWLLILAPLALYDPDSAAAIGVSGLLGLLLA